MKRTVSNQSGFTLIELILVIAILGILAVAVAPSFTNLLTNASTTGGLGTAGAIQSGINTMYAENVAANTTPFWVTTLDSASNGACSTSNPCFGNVVQPITSGSWTRVSDTEYAYENAGVSQTHTYDPSTGTFQCTAGTCS
jgi:prepilin-type N-terminal cleavage/methylation domain-containing protein